VFDPVTMLSFNLSATLCLLSLWTIHARSQTCYWPDGSQADAVYKPCANNKGACCYYVDDNHHDLCYDNGFCYSLYWGYNYRGACADSTWPSGSGCATDCLDGTFSSVQPSGQQAANSNVFLSY
jgi:hypothetical protein